MKVSSEGLSITNDLESTDNLTKTTNTHEHIAEYIHKKKLYYETIRNEYMQDNPRINQQNRQKITFHGSANPKEISQQCTPATHTAVHCQLRSEEHTSELQSR